MLPLGSHLSPANLLGGLFRPGLILDEVLSGKTRLFSRLCEHLLPLFLPVLVLVADGVCVHGRLGEIRKRFPPQLGHLRQAEEGEAAC